MSVVLYERVGNVAVITLNRPEARNSLSPEVLVRLDDAWREVAADDGVRVAVLTGTGDKAFCAGADLGTGKSFAFDYAEPRLPFERILRGRGLVRDDRMKFISQGEHLHTSHTRLARRFEELAARLGAE